MALDLLAHPCAVSVPKDQKVSNFNKPAAIRKQDMIVNILFRENSGAREEITEIKGL